MKNRKLIIINTINTDIQEKSNYFEPRVLGIIAALTPNNWDIKIIDENIEDFSYCHADLVAITSFTSSINETYRIAKIYKDNNIPVVVGGVHSSFYPHEVNQFAHTSVVGDAETTWGEIIEDFESNNLKSVYYGNNPQKFATPKRSEYFDQYSAATIETSRGCPMNCEFCSVAALYKSKYYFRPLNEIIDELKNIKNKYLFFSDDNMYGISRKDNQRFKSLCKEIINNKINKPWIGFASLNIANDSESLKLAYKSGCRLLMIGFESEDQDVLKSINKTINAKYNKNEISKLVKKIQSAHIGIIGGFIFGFDSDSLKSIASRRTFINSLHLDIVSFVPLTAYPGTRLFNRLNKEDKLLYTNFPLDWSNYSFENFTFKHPILSFDDIKQIEVLNDKGIYSKRKIYTGYLYSIIRTKSLKTVKHIYKFRNR